MKKYIVFVMLITMIGLQFSCNSGPKQRKDGDIPYVLGEVIFDENGDGSFCLCKENECWALDGGIQYKALRKVWVMWQRQHPGEKVYGKLKGFYYSIAGENGKRQGALTIDDFRVNQNFNNCNDKAND